MTRERLPVAKRTWFAEIDARVALTANRMRERSEQNGKDSVSLMNDLRVIHDEFLWVEQYKSFKHYVEARVEQSLSTVYAQMKKVQEQLDYLPSEPADKTDNLLPLKSPDVQTARRESEQVANVSEREMLDLQDDTSAREDDCSQSGMTENSANNREQESHEEPSNGEVIDQSGAVLDAEGQPVPERAIEAFENAKAINSLCREIDSMTREAQEIARKPGGRLIRVESVKQQLKDAKANLWQNRPTHLCPYCQGSGEAPKGSDDDICNCCRGEGWTAKYVWEQAPGNRK